MVMKKTIVYQEDPLYTYTNFHTSGCVHMRTAARNLKGACVLGSISQPN